MIKADDLYTYIIIPVDATIFYTLPTSSRQSNILNIVSSMKPNALNNINECFMKIVC